MKDLTNQGDWNRCSGRYHRFVSKDAPIYDVISSLIRIHLHPGIRVLELAAGTGLLSQRLSNSGASIIATDYSESMVEKAKARRTPFNLTFETADACNLQYESHSFDVVILANALPVIPHPEQAIAQVRRVLKPNGLFICPTFVKAEKLSEKFRSGILLMAGRRRFRTWDMTQLCEFLETNQMHVTIKGMLAGSMPMAYIEAKADSPKAASLTAPLTADKTPS